MKKTLGVYQFIHNATIYDYPFIESLNSALPVADEIVIGDCSSTDDTSDRIKTWVSQHEKDNKIKVIQLPWVQHFTQLSGLGNSCAKHLTTDWHWQLQADEVIHENSYDLIKSLIENLNENYTAISVAYMHFVANYETEFDFCYKKAIRIARKNSQWHLVSDAAQLDGEDVSRIYTSNINVYHYGKVHAGKVGWKKEWDFMQLFKDIGFPDPKIMQMKEKFGAEYCDYLYLFEDAIKKGTVRKFNGTHPKLMKERIESFKLGGFEQFQSKFKDELKL